MNSVYINLFLSTGVPPPFARWWKSASNHNGSDSYVKYLFSCHSGSVDKNNFIYCHGGGIKNWKFEKKSWESTGNFVICLQFNFYQNRLKIKKVRAMPSWGGKSDFSLPGSAAVWVRPLSLKEGSSRVILLLNYFFWKIDFPNKIGFWNHWFSEQNYFFEK